MGRLQEEEEEGEWSTIVLKVWNLRGFCVCVWIVRAVQCREKKKKEDDRESWSKREDTNTKEEEEEPNALASRVASEEEYKMKGKRMYKRLKK